MTQADPQSLVESWSRGSAEVSDEVGLTISAAPSANCAAKLRSAYRWILEHAILSPYVDVEYGHPAEIAAGEGRIVLHEQAGYSSFILLPLLTLVTSRRMVFVGGPGRGKTSVATLMGLLAGYSLPDVRRSIQHGHPQLTVADLLGSPLPSDLVRAETVDQIRVAWREWITMRVKIIDEYNRIPTKTQSALLSLMADGYAQMYEQTVHCDQSAWFLTANDDLGGGTFPVIEALRDRIDVVVRCTPFHAEHLSVLADRVAANTALETFVPQDLILTADDLASADREIRAVVIPDDVMAFLGFFLGQLDFCRQASERLEFMNKDTLKLSGRRVAHVCTEDCPLDKHENLCTQTENGVSPRAYQALLHYAKAIAWFRGAEAAGVEDFRQVAPWVLFEKLRPNPQSAFFRKDENRVLTSDRVSWIRQLFDRAIQQSAAFAATRKPIDDLRRRFAADPPANRIEIKQRMEAIQHAIENLLAENEFNAPVYEEAVRLKHLYVQHQQFLADAKD